jgi:hypothetical protein
MRTRFCRPVVGCLAAFALLSPAEASAAGIVLVTWGETISHVGKATPQAEQTQGIRQVGFKYGYFGVFWIDLWTHGGTYCVYEGKRYDPVSPAEAARLLGKSEDQLSTPFLYRFPLGLLIFGPLIVLGIIVAAVDKGKGDETVLLFQDARYQKALEILNAHYSKPPSAAAPAQQSEHVQELASPLMPADRLPRPLADSKQPLPAAPAQSPGLQPGVDEATKFRAAFEAGVHYLIGVGIPREEAERNLAVIIQVLTQAPQQEAPAPTGSPPG